MSYTQEELIEINKVLVAAKMEPMVAIYKSTIKSVITMPNLRARHSQGHSVPQGS
jgi:hypothetical protein